MSVQPEEMAISPGNARNSTNCFDHLSQIVCITIDLSDSHGQKQRPANYRSAAAEVDDYCERDIFRAAIPLGGRLQG
jgi:hypothetical protein